MAYSSGAEESLPDLLTEEGKLEMLTKLTESDRNICDDDKYNDKQFGNLETYKYGQMMKPDMSEHDDIVIATVEAAVAYAGEEGLTISELSKKISDLSGTWFDLPKLASLMLPGLLFNLDNPESILQHDVFKDIVECVDGNKYRLKRNSNNERILAMEESRDMAEQLSKMRKITETKPEEKKDRPVDSDRHEKDEYDFEHPSSDERSYGNVQSDAIQPEDESNANVSSNEESTSCILSDQDLNGEYLDNKKNKVTEKVFKCARKTSSEGSFQIVSKPTSSGSTDSTKDHARPTSEKVSTKEPQRHASRAAESTYISSSFKKTEKPKMASSIVRKGCYSDEEESESSVELNDGNISDDEASSPPVEAGQENSHLSQQAIKDAIHQDLTNMQRDTNRSEQDKSTPPPYHKKPTKSPEPEPRRTFYRAPSPPIIVRKAPPSLVAKKLQHVPGMVHPIAQVVKDREAMEAREKKRQMDMEREKRRQEQQEAEWDKQQAEKKLKQLREDEELAKRLERQDFAKEKGAANDKPKGRFNQGGWNPQFGTSAFDTFNNKGYEDERPFGQGERQRGFGTSPSPKGFDQRAPPRKNRFNNKSPSFDKSSHAAQVKEKNDWFSNRPVAQPQQPRQITPEIIRPVPSYASPTEQKRMPQSSSAHQFGERDYGRADQRREGEAYSQQSPVFSSGYQGAERNARPQYDEYQDRGSRHPENNFGGYGQNEDMYNSRSSRPQREQQPPLRAPSTAFGNQYRDEFYDKRLGERMSMHRDTTRGTESRMSSYGRNEDPYARRNAAPEPMSRAPTTYETPSNNHFYDQRQPEPDRQFSRNTENSFGSYRTNEETFGSRSSMSRSMYDQSGAPSSIYSSQNRDMRPDPHRYADPAPVRHDQGPSIVAQTPQPQPPRNSMIDFIKAYMILFAKQGSEIQWTEIRERCLRFGKDKFRFNHPSDIFGKRFADHLMSGLAPLIHVFPIGPEEILFALNDDKYKGWESLSSNLEAVFVTAVYDLAQGFAAKTAIKWSIMCDGLQLPAPDTIFGPNWAVDFTRIAHELQMPIKAVKSIHDNWITLL